MYSRERWRCWYRRGGSGRIASSKGDGNLHVLWWSGQEKVGHADLTRLARGPQAVGDPASFTSSGTNLVVYRATDGHVHSVYWTDGPSGHENLSGYARSPRAAGDPHGYYTAHNDASHLVYRGTDHHIHEFWWVGANALQHWDLSAIAGAPAAASDPVSFYSPHTNTKHVFYRAADGHLIELWWFPGGGQPAFVDLSAQSWAPLAVSKPGAFANGPFRHVVYRGEDHHIHEIRFA